MGFWSCRVNRLHDSLCIPNAVWTARHSVRRDWTGWTHWPPVWLDTMDDRPRWRRHGSSDSSERPCRASHDSFSLIECNSYTHINTDTDTEPHGDTDTEPHTDTDTYDNRYTDNHTRTRLHTVKLSHADAHSESHTLRELHADTDIICYGISDTNGDTDSNPFSSDWRIAFRYPY